MQGVRLAKATKTTTFYPCQLILFPFPAGPAHQNCNDACKAQRINPLAGRALFAATMALGRASAVRSSGNESFDSF